MGDAGDLDAWAPVTQFLINSWDLSEAVLLLPCARGHGPGGPSHPFLADCVGAGAGGQMGRKDHPQRAGRVAAWAQHSLLLAGTVDHQPHEELVGPGDAKGWAQALVLGPGTHRMGRCCSAKLRLPHPMHSGPSTHPSCSMASVT